MKPALPDPSAGIELGVGDVAALAESIRAGGCLLVDCREEDEWDFSRLPGARLVPLSRFSELAAPLVDAGTPVVVYCHHGMRSLRAASWLRASGLDRAWSMSGGIDAWSDLIDPTVPKY